MGKIINLFNHKGGVSKTTTVFNLAWLLGTMGKKVIVADFDPQCNLTGMVLGTRALRTSKELTRKNRPTTSRTLCLQLLNRNRARLPVQSASRSQAMAICSYFLVTSVSLNTKRL